MRAVPPARAATPEGAEPDKQSRASLASTIAWQPIETAPKDVPILAWCKTTCDDARCAFSGEDDDIRAPDGPYGLCLYHGHAEGMSSCGEGLQIVEWGGGWDDNSHEYSGGWMPDWWFRAGSEFEESANPTHWMPLPDAPTKVGTDQ